MAKRTSNLTNLDQTIRWGRGNWRKKKRKKIEKKKDEREVPPSLYIFWQSDRRFGSEQEVKLVYASRATREYQNQWVSSTSER